MRPPGRGRGWAQEAAAGEEPTWVLTCGCHCRCTLQQDCANSSQQHFWTSASEGPSRCPTMTVLPAEIDVHREYPVSGGPAPTSGGAQGRGLPFALAPKP